MNYRLKVNENGKVNALLKTGNDFVKTELDCATAEKIVSGGKGVDSNISGYPIHVDDWYLEGVPAPVPGRKGKNNEKDVLH